MLGHLSGKRDTCGSLGHAIFLNGMADPSQHKPRKHDPSQPRILKYNVSDILSPLYGRLPPVERFDRRAHFRHLCYRLQQFLDCRYDRPQEHHQRSRVLDPVALLDLGRAGLAQIGNGRFDRHAEAECLRRVHRLGAGYRIAAGQLLKLLG